MMWIRFLTPIESNDVGLDSCKIYDCEIQCDIECWWSFNKHYDILSTHLVVIAIKIV